MKILHTADLHLGRSFAGHSLAEDHAAVLDQMRCAIAAHTPDVLIIAGDIFDRAAPPETAVRLFNAFLGEIARETTTAIVMIAGNHDSGERIGAMSMLAEPARTLVRGPVSAHEPALVLHDDAGPVCFSALPFAYEYAARTCFPDAEIKAPADVLAAQVAAARAHLPAGTRWVVVAHAFVAGAAATESERPLSRTVGGIETVPADVFNGADYVALGHLHRPQAVGAPHIRYAGSPLAFGFDEERQEKSMTLVELAPDGSVEIELVAFHPLRQVRTVRGLLETLVADDQPRSDDWIRIVLTDTTRMIEPMKRLRERYPNACLLEYEAIERGERTRRVGGEPVALAQPIDLLAAFLECTRGDAMTDAEAAVLNAAISAVSSAGADADRDTDKDAAA